MKREPGAALTRAERFRYKTRHISERARDVYQEQEDRWIESNASALEERGAGWKIMLRNAQRTGPLARAHRTWKRARRWAAVGEMIYQQRKRQYYDSATMGTGG